MISPGQPLLSCACCQQSKQTTARLRLAVPRSGDVNETRGEKPFVFSVPIVKWVRVVSCVSNTEDFVSHSGEGGDERVHKQERINVRFFELLTTDGEVVQRRKTS